MATPTNRRSFHNLTTPDMKLLTMILSHQPSPAHAPDSSTQSKYRELTKKDIEKLPAHLKKESGQEKNLCKMHAGLNSAVIAAIFNWVQNEVDDSLPRSLTDPITADVVIADEIMEPFLQLLDIKSMWMPSSTKRHSKQDKRWTFQRDGCKACILARLGGEEDIVTPLRASVVARLSPENKPRSRRLVWLAALIYGCFTEEVLVRIMGKSEFLGGALGMANREAAFKKAKYARYWNPTAISPKAMLDIVKEEYCPERRPGAQHIADVVKEVRPFSDEITRVERNTQQEFQAWQEQQRVAQRREKRRSISPVEEVGPHTMKTFSNPFTTPPPSTTENPFGTPPALPRVLRTSLATPSPPALRPRTSYVAAPPPFPLPTARTSSPPRPRTSHATPPRREPPPVPTTKDLTPETISPTLPPVPRNSCITPPPNAPPPPPPKDMNADLLRRMDSLWNMSHPRPTLPPPPVPPKSPPKHTLLPRLNTNTQTLRAPRLLIPSQNTKRSSSIYSQAPPFPSQQSRIASSIYETADTPRENIQRSRSHFRKPSQQSPDTATSTSHDRDREFGRWPHISPPLPSSLPKPTPDSAEEYRALIHSDEKIFLAPSPLLPTPPTLPPQMNRGRTSDRSRTGEMGARSRFRPLSPRFVNQQFGGGLQSPTSAQEKEHGQRTWGLEIEDGARDKEIGRGMGGGNGMGFGSMRARFRPEGDEEAWRRMIEAQEKEKLMAQEERGSLDSFAQLYEKL